MTETRNRASRMVRDRGHCRLKRPPIDGLGRSGGEFAANCKFLGGERG